MIGGICCCVERSGDTYTVMFPKKIRLGFNEYGYGCELYNRLRFILVPCFKSFCLPPLLFALCSMFLACGIIAACPLVHGLEASMAAFHGFSTEHLVPLPAEFLTDVLPFMHHPSEIKVTLHVFWLVSRQRGRAKRIAWESLVSDDVLAQSMRTISSLRPVAELIDEGLRYAVERGTLLHVVSNDNGRATNWYLVNTAANRTWVERQRDSVIRAPDMLPPPKPTIFTLYEQNIGLLTPMLIDELRQASVKYPAEWLEQAVRMAVEANARNWRYIRRILERWETDGKASATHGHEQSFDLRKYTSGKYAEFFGRTNDE